jgi:hypothetical protein
MFRNASAAGLVCSLVAGPVLAQTEAIEPLSEAEPSADESVTEPDAPVPPAAPSSSEQPPSFGPAAPGVGRGWFYPAGALYGLLAFPVDTGEGTSPIGASLGFGGELMAGLSPAFRGGLWLDYALGGLQSDVYGDRFNKTGNSLEHHTLRVGLRARVTPLPLAGVLPFVDGTAGWGASQLELLGEETCTTDVNGQEECEAPVEDEASFSGTLLGIGVGVEIDVGNMGTFDAFSPKAPASGKLMLRGGYSWYNWSGDAPANGQSTNWEVDRQVFELTLGVTYW